MLQPPVTDLAPWRPGHWIMQTGYALNESDVQVGVKDDERCASMRSAVIETNKIITKVMRK